MGGNALSVNTRRLSASEYYTLRDELLSILKQYFPEREITDIPAYKEKNSFGDIDILVSSDGLWVESDDPDVHHLVIDPEFLNSVKSATSATELAVQKNSLCFSFDFKKFQADIILTPLEEFKTTLDYYSYNDLGNLIGRVANALGFKYGFTGLRHIESIGTQKIHDLTVSKDTDKILEFLGYDAARFHKGFLTRNEIFKYAESSPYCSKNIFLLENRNYKGRTRDRKRSTYRAFLQHLKESDTPYSLDINKSKHLSRAFTTFPEFKTAYYKSIQFHKDGIELKKRFNGQIVSNLTGLTGKELGAFMKDIRESFVDDSHMRECILSSDENQLRNMIKDQYHKYTGKMKINSPSP